MPLPQPDDTEDRAARSALRASMAANRPPGQPASRPRALGVRGAGRGRGRGRGLVAKEVNKAASSASSTSAEASACSSSNSSGGEGEDTVEKKKKTKGDALREEWEHSSKVYSDASLPRRDRDGMVQRWVPSLGEAFLVSAALPIASVAQGNNRLREVADPLRSPDRTLAFRLKNQGEGGRARLARGSSDKASGSTPCDGPESPLSVPSSLGCTSEHLSN